MPPITPPTPKAKKGPWAGGTWTGECGAVAEINAELSLRDSAFQAGQVALAVSLRPGSKTTIRCALPFRHKGAHSPVPAGALSWED